MVFFLKREMVEKEESYENKLRENEKCQEEL